MKIFLLTIVTIRTNTTFTQQTNKIIKGIFIILCSILFSLSMVAQNDTLLPKKPLNIWVNTADGKEVKGKLAGRVGNNLLIKNKNSVEGIPFQNILTIKTKKPGGGFGGAAKGALIGLVPVVFGEGGAYAAFITMPVGLITGAIIGSSSKKKHRIDKNSESFMKFSNRYLK